MNLKPLTICSTLGGVLILGACTSLPTGPNVMVLPGSGQSMEQFQLDDLYCRNFAQTSIGGQANNYAEASGLKSAVIGSVVGALAGAAADGRSGAATGAGIGLLGGALSGSEASASSQRGSQKRYDMAYTQCMYAKGHKVPIHRQLIQRKDNNLSNANIPPPPPGSPPPPPKR